MNIQRLLGTLICAGALSFSLQGAAQAEDPWDTLEALTDEDWPIAFHALFSTGYQNTALPALSQALQDRDYGAINPDFWSAGVCFRSWPGMWSPNLKVRPGSICR